MAQERKVGSVTYQEVGQEYFQQRGLRRHAGVWSLWALGVAAVISGDFFGWNLGLLTGGFGGLAIATVFITIMYIGLCYSIAEMSPALPHTGGAYSFGRSAMGPWGGFITGLAENMEYVVTPAVVVVAIGAYMNAITIELFDLDIPLQVWWAIAYAIFLGLNIAGIETTMRFTVVICFMSLAILAFFFIAAFTDFSVDHLTNIPPEPGNSEWLPFGISGIFKNLPFAIWFYLAIEELPLAAEESMDPKRDIPKATMWGLWTLVIFGVGTLVLNTGTSSGAAGIGGTAEPLFLGFQDIFGDGTAAALLALIAVVGLVASFHTIIFAYGRNIFSLSRAGYFPKWLSITHGTRKTPYVALLVGGVVGYGLAWWINESAGTNVGASLLTMAVFGAVISYFMQMLSFIMLRRKLPDIERPYRSPVGVWGAAIAGIIALVSLVSLYLDDSYRPGVVGTAIWFILGLLYFAIAGRNRLVLSPEEEFALTQGERGIPQEAGYTTSREEQEEILGGGGMGAGTPQPPPGAPPSG
ncbi:MAG TPA: ethanolamine permease [Actinomycetota bacterium]|nr:ethanolamine permease [Actinomycetota bacterium]